MAGVSVPVTAQPTAPNSLPNTPSTVHGKEDAIFNKIQAKLSAAVSAAHPTPGVPVPAQIAPPIQAQPLASEAVTLPEEIELNLDDIDFNAPPSSVSAPDQTNVALKPHEIETKLAAEIAEAGAEADAAKLWDKVDALAVMHPRGKQMVEGLKFMRAIAAPPTEDGKGGIGRQITLDEIKAGDAAHRELQLVRHELINDPKSFVHNLITLKENGQSWLGDANVVASVVSELPKILLENVQRGGNPVYGQLMANLAGPIFDQFLNYQYQVAQSWPGGEPGSEQQKSKDRFLDALQVVEHRMKGSARSLDPANGRENPETIALRRQLEESRARETGQRQSQVQQMMQAIEFANGDSASKAIDVLFDKFNISKALSKTTLEPQKNAIAIELDRDLQRLNPGGYQQYQFQLEQVSRGQISPEVAKQTYATLFQNGLRISQSVRNRLTELAKDAKRITDSSTQRLQASQQNVAPDGTGRMAAASVVPGANGAAYAPWDPKSGLTREEHMAKSLSARMMAATPVRR